MHVSTMPELARPSAAEPAKLSTCRHPLPLQKAAGCVHSPLPDQFQPPPRAVSKQVTIKMVSLPVAPPTYARCLRAGRALGIQSRPGAPLQRDRRGHAGSHAPSRQWAISWQLRGPRRPARPLCCAHTGTACCVCGPGACACDAAAASRLQGGGCGALVPCEARRGSMWSRVAALWSWDT